MTKKISNKIEAKGFEVSIVTQNQDDFISLTDIAKYKNLEEPRVVIFNWMSSYATIDFLATWEELNNSNFNRMEFHTVRNAAIGPYAQAIEAGNTLYISGQVPLCPVSMETVSEDVQAQTRQCMENLKAILEEAGYSFQNVVKCGIFLKNLADFMLVNFKLFLIFFLHLLDLTISAFVCRVFLCPLHLLIQEFQSWIGEFGD